MSQGFTSQLPIPLPVAQGGTGASAGIAIDGSQNFQFNSGYGSVATSFGVRAWAYFNNNTPTLNASGNVSSIANISTGSTNINFTNAMPDTNYCCAGSAGNANTLGDRQVSIYPISTSQCRANTGLTAQTTMYTSNFVNVIVTR